MTQQERLRYLVEGLVAEYNERHNEHIEIPMNEEEQFTLFRSLCNIRPAGGMSLEWMKIESEYLNILANNKLLGCFAPNHKCIDNEIHTFAGIELRMECARMTEYMEMPEKTGVARMTYGYNLPAKHVLHTVGPIIYESVTDKERIELASCYQSCLKLANAYNLRSIAFCCISTGEFRFPNEEAAQIAIDTVRTYLKETNSKIQVVFNVFKDIDYDIYNKLLS